MNAEQLLRHLRALGIPEAEIALAIWELCQQLHPPAVNRGTGPACPNCGERQLMLERSGQRAAWGTCRSCGSKCAVELELEGPGLQQLMAVEGIDEDEQPYFWELPS